jgi:hypothetical protein
MKRKLDIVLLWSGSKFFVKMTITQSFRNLKNWSQDQIESSIKKIKIKISIKGSFWNQEADNTGVFSTP